MAHVGRNSPLLRRQSRRSWQTWRAFLEARATTILAADFFHAEGERDRRAVDFQRRRRECQDRMLITGERHLRWSWVSTSSIMTFIVSTGHCAKDSPLGVNVRTL